VIDDTFADDWPIVFASGTTWRQPRFGAFCLQQN
jgi:hypothetical protein